MAFEQILELTKATLTARGAGIPPSSVEALRALPSTVLVRRSFGVDDDRATAAVLADQIELDSLRSRLRSGSSVLLRHPKHLVDAWSMCETLRRLGFSMEKDMYVGWGTVVGQGDDVVYIVLEHGGVNMKICASRFTAASKEEALAGWDVLMEDLMRAGDDDLAILYARSVMGETLRVVALASELVRQGFKIRGASALTIMAGPAVTLSPGGES